MTDEQPHAIAEHERTRPYRRLQVDLAALIAATPPGDKLISEPQLARQLGVSRATLREAMRIFEGQGLIRRRQGVGTFVMGNTRVLETGLEVLESIETLAHRIGLDVALGDVNIETIQADANLAVLLQTKEGAPLTCVVRVILSQNRPVAYLTDILPEAVLKPADLQNDFSGSVLDFLIRRGEPRLDRSMTEIRSVPATPEIARALQIQRGDALLMFVAQLYDKRGNVVDYSTSYYLPGTFRFHVVRSLAEPGAFLSER